MQPLVTVVILALSDKARLVRAIGSVLRQTYRPVELVIVDERATPDIDDAVGGLDVGIRVRILRSSGPIGAAAGQNKGIAAAAGAYIAFFEAHDHWVPSKLARQVATAVGHSASDGIVVYTQREVRDRGGPAARPCRAIAESEKVADYLFANGGYIDAGTVLVSTALARRVLYRPELRQHEDWDWYIRLEEHGAKFHMVPEPLCISGGHDARSDGRLSRPDLSLVALETWKPLISSRAYLAFRAAVVPHMRDKAVLPAIAMIVDAYVRGAIPSRLLAVLLRRLFQPERLGVAEGMPASNGAAVRSDPKVRKLLMILPRVPKPGSGTRATDVRGHAHHGER